MLVKVLVFIDIGCSSSKGCGFDSNYDQAVFIIIIIIIITKIYIAHITDGKINHQIESEAHKKVDLTNI